MADRRLDPPSRLALSPPRIKLERNPVNDHSATSPSSPSPLSAATEAEHAEDQFFRALLAGDFERIEELLTQDFLIIDVISGGVADRTALIAALRDRRLEFARVDLVERRTRRHGDTAIIVGRTDMAGTFEAANFAAASRYTHVLRREADGRWRLANAQGTRVVDA
jgi:ketosteroid isomerase-like protein